MDESLRLWSQKFWCELCRHNCRSDPSQQAVADQSPKECLTNLCPVLAKEDVLHIG